MITQIVHEDRAEAPTGPLRNSRTREAVLVALFGLLLTVAYNFPLLRNPRSSVTHDIGDPLLQAWQLAWLRHFLMSGGDLWTTNMFHPSVDTLAFSDSLLGYLPFAVIGGDGQYGAVLRYNAVYLFAAFLAFVGCYLLARQLGGSWQAASLAGVAFAWAPWRATHVSHLNILSTGGIALALFALSRGYGYSFRHGLRSGLVRPWWALAGWLIAAWQITLGFALGIPFFYVMVTIGIVLVYVSTVRRKELGWRLLVFSGTGAAIFLAVSAAMAIPYLRVVERYGFKRTWPEFTAFSAPWEGLWTSEFQVLLWRNLSIFTDMNAIPEPSPAEKMLFPGLAVVLLALAGLFVSAWSVRVRVMLGVLAAVASVLALGVTVAGGAIYNVLWSYLPGWDSMRAPGRLILWASLALILLAVGAVTRLSERLRGRRWMSLLLVAPVLLAILEGVQERPYPSPPGIAPDLKAEFAKSREPMLVLPMDIFSEYSNLLWSTEGFPTLANGTSGNFPTSYWEILNAAKSFPDTPSLEVLAKHGVRKVVVIKVAAARTEFAQAATRPVAGLPVIRQESTDIVVFTLR